VFPRRNWTFLDTTRIKKRFACLTMNVIFAIRRVQKIQSPPLVIMCFALAGWRNGWIVTWSALAVTENRYQQTTCEQLTLSPDKRKFRRGWRRNGSAKTLTLVKRKCLERRQEQTRLKIVSTIVTSQPTAIQNKTQSAILKIQITKHCWK
jgi:hypothetical protein